MYLNHIDILTDVRSDDGEGAQVGLPHVLGQCVCVFLVVSQQRGRAALSMLDQLPVRLCFWSQDAAAHRDQILSESSSELQNHRDETFFEFPSSLQKALMS